MRNHILGTLLLIGLTAGIALPIGVGSRVFLSEYARGWLATMIRMSTALLRAISLLILGLTAVSLIRYTGGMPLSGVLTGTYRDANGVQHTAGGSFVLAAIVLSLLIIPVVSRATEEGCSSLPGDLREGSLSLGASEGHTLTRVVLPWALPNIVTGLVLGCAEAAGSVAILLFIAGAGDRGVGPLSQVTSLSFLIFEVRYGPKPFRDLIGPYQFSAALLLLVITLGLTVAALVLKRRFASRYRGV
jgi:ABC-type phosphate transport system permease subunit